MSKAFTRDVGGEAVKRSRRDFLTGAVAGVAGAVGAAAVTRPTNAYAANGDPVVLGSISNNATFSTSIINSTPGLFAFGTAATGNGIGLTATSESGPGVQAFSDSGDGVFGTVQSGANAVHGKNSDGSASGIGVFGEHTGGGVAVQGNSLTASSTSTGVLGYGQRGVYGLALLGGGGTGVVASSALDGTGVALEVIGPATFTGSGIVSIAAGKKSVTVTGVQLKASSLVLATVQNNAGVWVAFATPRVPGQSLTVTLNKAVPVGKTAKVAWFVVN